MHFADILKNYRINNNLSQAKLAEILGTGQKMVSSWELGQVTPRDTTVHRVFKILGIDSSLGETSMEGGGSPYADIPLYYVEAAAGEGIDVINGEEVTKLGFKKETLAKRGINPDHSIAIRVNGESMMPYLLHGDVVFVDRDNCEVTGLEQIFVFRHDNAIMVKGLRKEKDRIIVRSKNPDFDPYIIGPDDLGDFQVLGRVFNMTRDF